MSADHEPGTSSTASVVVLTAGVSEPSSTRMLADRVAQKSVMMLADLGLAVEAHVIELAPLAVDVARATTSGFPGSAVENAIRILADADAVIVATPRSTKQGSVAC